MDVLALEVSILLARQNPAAWGDPDDSESTVAALEELAQTCRLLISSPSANTHGGGDYNTNNGEPWDWLRENVTKIPPHKPMNETDLTLPRCFLRLRDVVLIGLRSVLETSECSAMGPHEYYRQKMRPLAFAMIGGDGAASSCFDHPKHYHAPGGGYERVPHRWKTISTSTKQTKSKASSSASMPSATTLWKELSTYPTALPIEYRSSIFARVLKSELDKLRVLIIGPDDTPYANGCFFFDIAMGDDYPNKPPKLQFLTTSSFLSSDETVRFNPNLYNCGKVCLSLLGTWDGPGWTPKESTLLQVLVSLQSLVLGAPKPYFNEPDFEKSEGTASGEVRSKQYNHDIRRKTMRVAMIPFLHNLLGQTSEKEEALSGRGKKRKR